jgi:hypothetical protein
MIENEQKKKPGFSTRMNKKKTYCLHKQEKKMADLFSGRRFQGRHRVFVLVA